MKKLIVDAREPITLVGGGALEKEDLEAAIAMAARVVAADSGADSAMNYGVTPDVVVGDFDSISDDAKARLGNARLLHVQEQDTTDFDKALRSVAAPVVIAVGFLGARIDHQLAALHVLMQEDRCPCILVGAQEILFHLRGTVEVPTARGEVVSLFPMQPVEGRSDGLEWPIEGLRFDPMQQIGTSNRATGPVRLEALGCGLIVILEKHHLKDVMVQLAAQS
ncbi:thiamine diphosphokinase [Epibacterium ulvae]|uniref:thiamine diphosphokinase n=1 Tax=Epibacterium ulvae TaxID=1156985 RepID=UPI001BFCC76A|nr:thiamine diphosphokinase [Epibacterium ulvae]MBT8152333.1 thiamine diphosphokinase [Epibacterium ulvae]